MKRTLLVFLLLISVSLSARQRTDEELKNIARSVLQSDNQRVRRAKAIDKTLAVTGQLENVSIVTAGKSAFVVVSNDEADKPVVGYSFTEYNEKEMPDNFKWWLQAINASMTKQAKKALVPSGLPQSVKPLLTTEWGQNAPFNRLSPNRYPTGCVATAMAQFLYYYRYPLQGTGTHTYGDLSFDFGSTVFQWGNMLPHYDHYNEQQANAVASLMYACGVSVEMAYDVDGSSAYFEDIDDALNRYFGYETGNLYTRNSHSDDWMSAIYQELSQARPVLYGGQHDAVGHVFIIDGYDADGNVHVNWGWNGDYNGYFDIDALDPEGDGGYNQNQKMLVGCREYLPHPNLTTTKFTTSGSTLPGDSQTITFSITNDGIAFGGTVNCFISTSETSLGSKIYSKPLSLESSASKDISLSYTPASAATYYLTLTADDDGKNIIGTGTLLISDNHGIITFQDSEVKAICVENWDANGDGELSYGEAAAVNSIGLAFNGSNITSLDELRYFTGLTSIKYSAFKDCENLASITIPLKVSSIEVGLKEGYIESPFLGCSSLRSIKVEKGNPYYDSRNDCNAIIETASNELIIGCQNTIIPDDIEIIGTAAFYKCTGLTSIVIPESVTDIYLAAFEYCSNLTSLHLPESVSYIGCNAFEWCTSLTSINIPLQVTSIQSMTFWGCTSLKSITIPESVTIIGSGAFWGCSSLTSITIHKNVRVIVSEAFSGCSGLISIKVDEENPIFDSREDCNAIIETSTNLLCSGCQNTIIPKSVTAIAPSAFSDIRSLTSITIPEGVTTIGDWAFNECTGLTSITIPSTIAGIGNAAFQGCESLTSIDLPDGLASIGDWAFNLSGLTSVTIPDGVNSIGANAFAFSKLNTVVLGANIKDIGDEAFRCPRLKVVKCYAEDVPNVGNNAFETGKMRALIVPEKSIEKYKTTSPWNEFEMIIAIEAIDKSNIIFADDTVKSICVAKWDIDGDGELSRLEAALVETIDREFRNSNITSFDELQYFTGLSQISRGFEGCRNLTSISIPKNVTLIERSAFLGCGNLTSINIDSGNAVYDSREDCNAIIETATNTLRFGGNSTIIPNSVTSIGEYAFDGCSGLASVTIPNSVTSIGKYAFYGCSGLTSVTIPNSVKSIGEYAFYYCSGLTSISIANSVTYIGRSAFSSCKSLTSVVIPEGVTTIESDTFSGCSNLTSVTLSENISTIGDWAFYECSKLHSVTIPKSVNHIGGAAFKSCTSLSSIVIMGDATEIGGSAFAGCWVLADVYCISEIVPSAESNSFATLYSSTLHVPASAIEDYRTTAPWSSFGSIVPLKGDGVRNVDVHVKDDVAPWRTLDGRMLSGKPATKGIFIRNGKKMLVK